MFSEYIEAALSKAKYETLEDGSYMATMPGLRGVIARGPTVEKCHKDLIEVIKEWITIRLQRGLSIPALEDDRVEIRVEKSRLSKYCGAFGKASVKELDGLEEEAQR